MTGARKVDFLVAGVQKGGTSALFEYLREVPGLQLPAVKEAHFFDDESQDWAAPDIARYHNLFVDDGGMWGEATPIYLYWPNSLARIRTYNPQMRIILVFRDPVARAFSHWQMEFAKGKEGEPFAWCIREGRARVAIGDSTAPGHHRVHSYVERGFYGTQIANLLHLFPRDQLLFLRSDDLKRDPDGTIATVSDFLQVPAPRGRLTPKQVRAAPQIAYPSMLTAADRALLEAEYATEMTRFAALSGINF
jgi:hypothetical protein